MLNANEVRMWWRELIINGCFRAGKRGVGADLNCRLIWTVGSDSRYSLGADSSGPHRELYFWIRRGRMMTGRWVKALSWRRVIGPWGHGAVGLEWVLNLNSNLRIFDSLLCVHWDSSLFFIFSFFFSHQVQVIDSHLPCGLETKCNVTNFFVTCCKVIIWILWTYMVMFFVFEISIWNHWFLLWRFIFISCWLKSNKCLSFEKWISVLFSIYYSFHLPKICFFWIT